MTTPGPPDAGRRLVVLVRHAKAESGEGVDDHDRHLTDRGRRTAQEAGLAVSAHLPAPDLAWVSSAARAQETWAGLAAALRPGRVVVERDLYLAGVREVLDRVQAAGTSSMVVVGHNPTMEQALAALTGELRGMRPGAVAVVDVRVGRLVALVEPGR